MEKELEQWKEKCHQLSLKLNSIQQSHQLELEFHKDEAIVKEKEFKLTLETSKAESKAKEKKLQERISDLNDLLQDAKDESNLLKGQVDQQRRSLEQFKTMQTEKQIRNEHCESLKIREEQLSQELKSIRHFLEVEQSKLHALTKFSEQQKETIIELKEEIDSKDLCISQLQTRMREIDEEREEEKVLQQSLQIQNHINNDEELDPSKRGNSLFSEIEERRIRVEDELVRLRGRVARLTVENVDLKASLERGDCRSAIIVRQLQIVGKSEEEVIKEIKQLKSETGDLFEAYEDRLNALTSEYNRKLMQFRNGVDPNAPQLSELEVIRTERDRLLAQKIAQDREIFELRRDLKFANQQKIASEANIKILRVKLQALQDQFSKATDESRFRNFNNNGESDSSFSNTSLNSSLLNTSSYPVPKTKRNNNEQDDKKWLEQTILADEEDRTKYREDPTTEANKNSLTDKKKSRSEDIPECNQQ